MFQVWSCVLTRPLFIVAVMLALLVSAGVAYAQGTPTAPTIESVAVTSDPGEDGGYAIGDEIQVGLTFSEAVTVTGAPQLTLDVAGLSRTAEYSEGSTTTRLLFTYTVASGDEDTDGIAVVANGLALNGGALRAGATNATLAHAALQANDHKVDGIAPTVTVGGETRTYVPPDRQFSIVFYFSEKVYGITDRRDNSHQRRGSRRARHHQQLRQVAQVHPLGRDHPARSGGAGDRDPGGGRWRRCLRERNRRSRQRPGSHSGQSGDGGGGPDHLRLCRGRQGRVRGHPLQGQRGHSRVPVRGPDRGFPVRRPGGLSAPGPEQCPANR